MAVAVGRPAGRYASRDTRRCRRSRRRARCRSHRGPDSRPRPAIHSERRPRCRSGGRDRSTSDRIRRARRIDILVLAQAGPGEAIRLPRIDDICRAFAVHLALAFAHDDRRRVAVGIHFDPVFAGLPQREGEIRRVDLEHLVGIETTHADVQRALRQLQLGDAVVEIEDGHAGAGVHANHRAADLDLGPRTRIRPQAVAGGQRPIDRRLDPIVLAGGRKADRAGHVAEARDARWRVRAGQAADGQQCDAGHEGECSKTTNFYLHKDTLRVIALFGARIHRRPEYSSVALLLGSSKMR